MYGRALNLSGIARAPEFTQELNPLLTNAGGVIIDLGHACAAHTDAPLYALLALCNYGYMLVRNSAPQ